MMKLYRPLCSDVTLRLTVDISPDGDERDDVITSKFNTADDNQCTCCPSSDNHNDNVCTNGENCSSLICRALHRCPSSAIENDNNNSSSSRGGQNYAGCHSLLHHHHHHHRQHHHHNGSQWYARQNTPDKIAKDIYNQEHVRHPDTASTDHIRTLPLDEFKRSVEEVGNDYKETSLSLYDEMGCADDLDSDQDQIMDASRGASPKLSDSYADAKLSGCFNDNSSQLESKCSSDDDFSGGGDSNREEEEVAGSRNISYNGVKRRRRDSGTTGDSQKVPVDDDNDDDDDEDDVDDDETLNMETDVSDEYDDDVARVPEQLPVDLDEDVDVGDKLMTASMIESFYGEMDESMQVSMIKSGTEVEPIPDEMSRSIAEEIHDVILGGDNTKGDDVFQTSDVNAIQLPFPYPFTLKHAGHLFDKSRHHFTTASRPSRTRTSSSTSKSTSDVTSSPRHSTNSISPSPVQAPTAPPVVCHQTKENEKPKSHTKAQSGGKSSVATMTSMTPADLEVTHRGLHRFIPRHKDEINIGIGDPIHVIKESDDLWCEGINLRTNERGIFPAVYANDLTFLEESDDEDEYWKFSMRFLGSVEVTSHKGDDTLVQAIQKVAVKHKANVRGAPCSSLEISQYGIRMIDKSKEGHEKDAFSHFFALKNISFCGTHPKDNRYFAFITKHPRDYRFACHVFYGDRPTHRARDALGEAFKRFYQEYMAFTHPTEDIYIE